MQPAFLIIGLGNPGATYEHTRHNAGFAAVEQVAGDVPWREMPKFLSRVCEMTLGDKPVFLAEPHTFMNRSGEAVAKFAAFYKLQPKQILVLCDDVDLPLGTMRLRKSGSAGTHNGLKSVIEHMGEGFARVRLGVGPKDQNQDLATWVLSRMSKEDRAVLERMFQALPGLLEKFLRGETGDTTITVDAAI